MKHTGSTVLALSLFMFSTWLAAGTLNVDCDASPPGALSAALSTTPEGTTIIVTGTCHDALLVNKDDITIVGNMGTSNAIITGFFPQDRIIIDGAVRVKLAGLTIQNGSLGILSKGNADFLLKDIEIVDNIIGMDITNGSSAVFDGTVVIAGNQVFGMEVLTGSKVVLAENAVLRIEHNFLGAQVSINSTLFAQTGSRVEVHQNQTIGFSVNTGATAMLFNATLESHGNGLDGVDVVSAANIEADGDSEIISENNGRDGISIDNSTLNLFGFFSSSPGLPRITAKANGGSGVLVESTSKLDIGRNSSIIASDNSGAGVRLDDGSSAVLQRSQITNNQGTIKIQPPDDDDIGDTAGPADVIVTFGSRISFNRSPDNSGAVTPNDIGLAVCDPTSLSRGDVRCNFKHK